MCSHIYIFSRGPIRTESTETNHPKIFSRWDEENSRSFRDNHHDALYEMDRCDPHDPSPGDLMMNYESDADDDNDCIILKKADALFLELEQET